MSQSANVRSIEALEKLKAALSRFGSDARESLDAAAQEIQRTTEWLQERENHWRNQVRQRQAEVEQAQAALRRCLASGYRDNRGNYHPPDCSAYQQARHQAQMRLREAEAELQNVQQWAKAVQQAAGEYQVQAQRLAGLLNNEAIKAAASLERSANTLRAYAAVTPVSGSGRASGLSPFSNDASSSWVDQGVQQLPLSQVDLSDSHVQSAEDFTKVSYDEVAEGLGKLEQTVLPAVQNGADGDYFSQLDTERGLDYQHGYRRIYDAFYGNDAIRVNQVGNSYEVVNGYHRLFAAQRLGIANLPMRLIAPAANPGGSLFTPPEIREGPVGGPERRE